MAITVDPGKELVGRGLRNMVMELLDAGFLSVDEVHAAERMDERHVSVEEIKQTLRGGVLATEMLVYGKWRYRATRQGIYVIFTFDVDSDGAIVVVITTVRFQ
jgi:hypothetical protein